MLIWDLDDRVRITVHLPPGSEQGPQIDRGRLRWWGVQSAPAYRALINLAYAWYAPGRLQRPADNSRRHWLQVQDPARYPLLTDGTAANLCFPATSQHRKHRGRETLERLQEEG